MSRWWWFLFLGVLTSCAGASRAPEQAAAPADGWRYVFVLSEDLETLEATVCFGGAPPSAFVPQVEEGRRALVEASVVGGAALKPEPWGLALGELERGACVRYVLDLEELASSWGWGSRDRRYHDDDLVLTPDAWLWTSAPRPAKLPILAELRLPAGVSAVVPWPEVEPGVYQVPDSAWRIKAAGAFVRSPLVRFEAAGTQVQVARLGEGWTLSAAEVEGWVRQAVEADAALFGGQFPVPKTTVLLLPSGGDDVGFGMSTRGGGPAVTLTVGRGIDAAAARDNWTLYHELLHLGIPHLNSNHAWLYEGLATYYEPIAQVRAGLKSPSWAWERLHDGFRRGRSAKTELTLRQESAQMQQLFAYWPVYWGGAAVALMTDVELRTAKLPGGPASLDDQLQAMAACCLQSGASWEADDLLREARLAEGAPDLAAVSSRVLDQHDFPDVSDAYRQLGLRFDANGKLLTQPGDPGAALRIAIMGRDVESRDGIW